MTGFSQATSARAMTRLKRCMGEAYHRPRTPTRGLVGCARKSETPMERERKVGLTSVAKLTSSVRAKPLEFGMARRLPVSWA